MEAPARVVLQDDKRGTANLQVTQIGLLKVEDGLSVSPLEVGTGVDLGIFKAARVRDVRRRG